MPQMPAVERVQNVAPAATKTPTPGISPAAAIATPTAGEGLAYSIQEVQYSPADSLTVMAPTLIAVWGYIQIVPSPVLIALSVLAAVSAQK